MTNRAECLDVHAYGTAQVATNNDPVRVCFVIDNLFPAGIELQLLLLVARLDRSKVIPFLCLLDGLGERSRVLEPDDCPVIRLGVRHLCRPSSILAGRRLAKFFRQQKINVVHPLFKDSFTFCVPFAKLARVPCIAGFCVDLNFWMTRRDRRLAKFLNRFVDGTIANCEACGEAAVLDRGTAKGSVAIIPNGLDLSRFLGSAAKKNGRAMPAAKRVGLVANLRSVKNIESLVRAADKLATKHPNVRFEIAGEGDCRVQLQKLIDALKLRDRVILLGSVENIPKFLATLDVAVLCSLSEGSPNAIMEYMATGLPTIATDVGGSSELIEHEVTGLLVPAGNDAQLAAAIDRLLCDDGFAEKLGANARARAFSEFSVESQARRYEDFYITLMQKKQVRK